MKKILGYTFVNTEVVPNDLFLHEIKSIYMPKIHGYITIIWEREGLFFACKNDYNKLIPTISRLKQKILKRPNPQHRIELWECVNKYGVFDRDVEKKLMKIRGIDFLNHNYNDY